jgi:hypothetical protein
MALLLECRLKCVPTLIDNADIVREAMLRQQPESCSEVLRAARRTVTNCSCPLINQEMELGHSCQEAPF